MDLARWLHEGEDSPAAGDPRAFSIVLGGPLFQLLRRTHITGDGLELARRRVVAIATIAWLPLLILSLLQPGGRDVAVPFVLDVEVHVRFLVAVPLLVAAELLVHMRLKPVVQEFVVRGLVPETQIERFRECLRSAFRMRNSVAAEIAMLLVVYGVGIPFVWRYFAAMDVATWYATPSKGSVHLTLAGFWYALVSVPLFQFLLVRWYYRIFIWARFLWQVSRINLNLSAAHGDGYAGLGFLARTMNAFLPLAMAHGALLAANLANRIFHAGGTLMDARFDIAGVAVYMLVLVTAPLLVFAPRVNEARHRAVRDYSRLSQAYVSEFEAKWIPSGKPAAESALGTGDIQSLADLNNSLSGIRSTRLVPVNREALVKIVLATLLPIAPLLLTVIPAEELATRLLKLLL
jgi:hypothetical protein